MLCCHAVFLLILVTMLNYLVSDVHACLIEMSILKIPRLKCEIFNFELSSGSILCLQYVREQEAVLIVK